MTSTVRVPRSPTSYLPPLGKLSSQSLESISLALTNLRSLYFPPPRPKLSLTKRHITSPVYGVSIPDSGYASAEEEESDVQEIEGEVPAFAEDEDGEEVEVDVLRRDVFEREFAIKWLIGFTARSDIWLVAGPWSDMDNEDLRMQVVDDAASLLSAFAGDLEPEVAFTRSFSFPCASLIGGSLEVELNDAPLLSADHTSVGLQSWASSIVLAERMSSNPGYFGLDPDHPGLRILELGAGTGMLSIVASQLLRNSTIIATDYHPDVLSNLRSNITANLRPNLSSISVHTLDWTEPPSCSPFDTPFDIIFAADVIYLPDHAMWIRSCVERYLKSNTNSMFWLIIALRSTGRHEGLEDTVPQVFPASEDGIEGELVIFSREIAKKDGIGRADEGSYILFKIGWYVR